MKTITILLTFLLTLFSAYQGGRKYGHTCEYKECPFKGYTHFSSNICECEEGSDCDALDKIHFDYPELDYDECEELLFKDKYINNI